MNHYTHYDDSWISSATFGSYPDFGYRDAQGEYDNDADVSIFYKASFHNNYLLKKPFVFIEGISFDKESITENGQSYDDYFYQNGNYTSSQVLVDMLGINNPSTNPFVGYGTFNWATLVTGIDAEGYVNQNPLNVQLAPVLLDKLYCAGYDIVFADFVSGKQYIENNGEALYNALVELHNRMVANGSTEKMVICGASMGGLVARYAINKLEAEGHTDWVETFISFDAPQMGANINLGLQYTLKHLETAGGMLKEKYDKLTCPSASQLVNYSCLANNLGNPVTYTEPSPSLERQMLLNNPYFGWPQHCKKVAISNGSRLGLQQSTHHAPGDKILDIDGLVEVDIWALPTNSSSYQKVFDFDLASCLQTAIPPLIPINQSVRLQNCMAIDLASGSFRNDLNELQEPLETTINQIATAFNGLCIWEQLTSSTNNSKVCFIPTLSSCGFKSYEQILKAGPGLEQASLNLAFNGSYHLIDTNHVFTYFDEVFAPVGNQTHVEITHENIAWVMALLQGGEPIGKFQQVVIPDGTYMATQYIRAGSNVDKWPDCGPLLNTQTITSVVTFPIAQYNFSNPPPQPNNPDFTYEYIEDYWDINGAQRTAWNLHQVVNEYLKCGPAIVASNTSVIFKAGNYISLEPGFRTEDNAHFEAYIVNVLNCDSSGGRYAPPLAGNSGQPGSQQGELDMKRKRKLSAEDAFQVACFPNPANTHLQIQSGAPIRSLTVINTMGSPVMEIASLHDNSVNLDIQTLPNGIYFFKINSGEQHVVRKIVIEHN